MGYIIQIINQLVIILLLMAVGFYLRKTKQIDERVTDGLLMIVSKIGLPAATIVNMQKTSFSRDSFSDFSVVFICYCLCMFMSIALMSVICRLLKVNYPERGVLIVSGSAANIGFMGIPIVSAIYGDESLFYVTAGLIASNIVVFSLGMHILSKKHSNEKQKKTLREFLRPFYNATFMASILGLILYFLSIQIPLPVFKTLELLGGSVTQLAMLAIGSMLATAKFGGIIHDRRLLVTSAFKLVIAPSLAFFLLRPLGTSRHLLAVLILGFAMPTGNTIPSVASQLGNDARLASEMVLYSTILSLVTIPFIAWLVST